MIRCFTTTHTLAAVRSISCSIIDLLQRTTSADETKRRCFARSFNSYAHPFPYYGEPFPSHYADRFGHQVNPNFAQFYSEMDGRDSRLRYQFKGGYSPYSLGGFWRSYGPECFCRCCGMPFWGYQQYGPVNYTVGQFGGGVGLGNGRSQMMNSHIDPNAGCGGDVGGFDGIDRRNLGYENRNKHYGESPGYIPRYLNGNIGQHRQNLADSYYERPGGPGFDEPKIALDDNMCSQDGYRWKNQNFNESGEGDGRGRNIWSESRGGYDHYGPGHNVQSYSNQLHQGNGYTKQKNGNIGNHTSHRYNGEFVRRQPPNSNRQPMNSDQTVRQSPQISDVLRNGNNRGSHEHTQSVNMQSDGGYSKAGVWGSYGRQNLIRPSSQNLNGFQQNSNTSHGQNMNVDPHGGHYQKSFDAATIGEAGRLFQENKDARQDSVNVGYPKTWDESNMRNLYGPLPEFATDERPLNVNRTSAPNNHMSNINDSRSYGGQRPGTMVEDRNDISHGNTDATGRCQRIIDVLESEDKYRPMAPDNRFVPQSRRG